MNYPPEYFLAKWAQQHDHKQRIKQFNRIRHSFVQKPRTLLDIGAGYAFNSLLWQYRYGTQLWLMDGDADENTQPGRRTTQYGSSEDFQFYATRKQLESAWESQGITQYNWVDARNPVLPDDLRFDMITSWASCGFHYPLSTYADLIRKHSHPDTKIIIDFRKNQLHNQGVDFTVINDFSLPRNKKRKTLQIKLNE